MKKTVKRKKTKSLKAKQLWKIAIILVITGAILEFSKLSTLGDIIFVIIFIWIGVGLIIIKEPETGLLFVLGKYREELKPGAYLTIPFVWEVGTKTKEVQVISCSEIMYVKGKTKIGLKIDIYFVLFSIKKSILLPEKEIEVEGKITTLVRRRVRTVVLSKLKWHVGQTTFPALLEGRKEMEDLIMKESNAKDELWKQGYRVIGVEISDLDEEIESEAAKRRKIGTADAVVAAKKAEAVSNPLKDNYPAAIAMSAETIGKIINKTLEKIVKPQKREVHNDSN